MIGWLLNLAYAALLVAVAPVVLWRMVFQGKYRRGWREKLFGSLPRGDDRRPCLWIHAVSVGEVMQIRPVLEKLRSQLPSHRFLISTTTATGFDVAQTSFPGDSVCFFPLDFTWSVRRALRRVQPAAIVLVELELWPNLIRTAYQQQIPLLLINGRVSERSFRGYRRIRFLLRHMLNKFQLLAVQNELYGERLRTLGGANERLAITGSIKFDSVVTRRDNSATKEIGVSFGIAADEVVFIAGSTQSPEEEYALKTYRALRGDFPRLRLVLVPRHKERFEEVARLIDQRGFPLLRRSQLNPRFSTPEHGQERPVLLLDTLGELSACWGLADIAFVGGSLTNRGGQNMIEPAGYGAAVLFGQNTHNFRDVVEILLREGAARVVHNPEEMTAAVRALLDLPEECRALGARAQELVVSQQGATDTTVNLITRSLSESTSPEELRPADAA